MRTRLSAPVFGAILLLTLAVSACSGAGSSAGPSSPTPTGAPDPTFTVSGTVVGGSAPVEGVLVRVAGRSGTTDGNGFYSLSGVPASYGGVSAVKAGYAAARASTAFLDCIPAGGTSSGRAKKVSRTRFHRTIPRTRAVTR